MPTKGSATSSTRTVCRICSKSPVSYVCCGACNSYYHPGCFCRIKGAYIDMDGTIICCKQRRPCECKVKDKEISSLKARVSSLNSAIFEQSGQQDSSPAATEDKNMSARENERCVLRFDALLEEVAELRMSLVAQMEEVSTLVRGSGGDRDAGSRILRERMLREGSGAGRSLDAVDDGGNVGCYAEKGEKFHKKSGSGRAVTTAAADSVGPDREGVSPREEVSPRVLLLGDSHFRNMRNVVADMIGSNYLVQSVFKPNARFGSVVSNISSLMRTFSKSDFVFVCAGANDILRGLTIKREALQNTIKSAGNTNLVLLSVPYSRNNVPYNKLVYDFNCELYDIVGAMGSSGSVHFVDVNQLVEESDMAKDGLHLQPSGKLKIAKYMLKLITDIKCVDSSWDDSCTELRHVDFDNLIMIETLDDELCENTASVNENFQPETITKLHP